MLEALCRQSSTTLDIVHAEDGPPITQRTSGLAMVATAPVGDVGGMSESRKNAPLGGGSTGSACCAVALPHRMPRRRPSPRRLFTFALNVTLFTSTSVAIDVLPSRFHTFQIVSGQMQLVFFVGVVVRSKCIGQCGS